MNAFLKDIRPFEAHPTFVKSGSGDCVAQIIACRLTNLSMFDNVCLMNALVTLFSGGNCRQEDL